MIFTPQNLARIELSATLVSATNWEWHEYQSPLVLMAYDKPVLCLIHHAHEGEHHIDTLVNFRTSVGGVDLSAALKNEASPRGAWVVKAAKGASWREITLGPERLFRLFQRLERFGASAVFPKE
jgi:hypothetical protein